MSDHVRVVVRCRARDARETAAKLPWAVELPDDASVPPSVAVRAGQEKVFAVDHVFGPGADQQAVYEQVAAPLVRDFARGHNVTVLAYGQTGSGKTHTMVGLSGGDGAGIIPRALGQLFALEGDYAVRVLCLEVYREELRDLLAEGASRVRLVATPGATSAHGVAQVHVDGAAMGLRVLQRCLARRRVGSTRMNAALLRAHTVFAIHLTRKHGDAYRESKMNLVDLAGSEDICKSGAVSERAKEAGLINQSLLALGKVINALGDGDAHVPYRESKLTRLLQGLLGGKTKTALIATISPVRENAQETVSTLTYATKAKCIRSAPQPLADVLLKRVVVADLLAQLARATRDLWAARDKDGVYMSADNYNEYARNAENYETRLREADVALRALTQKAAAKSTELEAAAAERDSLRTEALALALRASDLQRQVLLLEQALVLRENALAAAQRLLAQADAQLLRLAKALLAHVAHLGGAVALVAATARQHSTQNGADLDSLAAAVCAELDALLRDVQRRAVPHERILDLVAAPISPPRLAPGPGLDTAVAALRQRVERGEPDADEVAASQQRLAETLQAVERLVHEAVLETLRAAFARVATSSRTEVAAAARGVHSAQKTAVLTETLALETAATAFQKDLAAQSAAAAQDTQRLLREAQRSAAAAVHGEVQRVLGDISNRTRESAASAKAAVARGAGAVAKRSVDAELELVSGGVKRVFAVLEDLLARQAMQGLLPNKRRQKHV